MHIALDVHYTNSLAHTACLGFENWTDVTPQQQWCFQQTQEETGEYEPGQFFKRELPHLLNAIHSLDFIPETIVVDSYVWLNPDHSHLGLGAHLESHLSFETHIIGVAKNSFHEATHALPLLRGESAKPLYITANHSPEQAFEKIQQMHGEYRMPTLLQLTDHLSKHPQNPIL